MFIAKNMGKTSDNQTLPTDTPPTPPAKKELELRLRFERMLSELSAKFVHIPAHKVDQEIEKGLRRLIDYLDVDRCSLAQFSDDKKTLPVTHTFSVPGVSLLTSSFLERDIPWYAQQVRNGEIVAVSNVTELPNEAAADKRFLEKHNTKSNLVIPLNVGGSLLGVLGLATSRKAREWPEDLIHRLKLVGEVFANALMRQRHEQELHQAFHQIKDLKDQLQAENLYLREEIAKSTRFAEIIGQSPKIRFMLRQVEKVAGTDSTVLAIGETGTGKELLAQAIHGHSKRKDRAMVKVNCAAIPPTLIENELFGREKGAYTGASTKQIGRFEAANGSTLFLDEISELPLEVQVKLLRVLQEKQFERLGSARTVSVDVRIIAATNQDLEEMVAKKRFREDLYYRLNVFPIQVPPLRERLEDIPLLVEAMVNEFSESMGKIIKRISLKSMNAMMQYRWPGNVRELRNIIERAMIMTSGPTLQIQIPQTASTLEPVGVSLEDVIRKHIINVLEKTNWRVSGNNGAAQILKLPPTTLESKMRKLGIKRWDQPSQMKVDL
jgi:formate hydrogenlyase transcriptional activator